MKLGIIGELKEQDFKKAKEKGLAFIELCVNDQAESYLEQLETLKAYRDTYEMPIASLGRWGVDKLDEKGQILEAEYALECRLIDAAAELKCPVYVTGCNRVKGLSYYANVTSAIQYFERLIAYGKTKNIKIATYNCRWNNFVHSDPAWELIHGHLPELGIKYDPSHAIYAGGDYLKETAQWGERFYHVHLKGALCVDGRQIDDPPAGMDQINWGAFIGLLYSKGYTEGLSIEPHSSTWRGDLIEVGVDFTIDYMKQYVVR